MATRKTAAQKKADEESTTQASEETQVDETTSKVEASDKTEEKSDDAPKVEEKKAEKKTEEKPVQEDEEGLASPYIHTNDEGDRIVASVQDGEYVEKVDNKSKRPLRRIHETFDTTGVAGQRVD